MGCLNLEHGDLTLNMGVSSVSSSLAVRGGGNHEGNSGHTHCFSQCVLHVILVAFIPGAGEMMVVHVGSTI